MTDKIHSPSTQIVTPSQTIALSPKSAPALLSHVSSKVETVDEEPYTIKCICNFPDDDGNTIYCETCDTWQHIECYYPHNIEDPSSQDFAHSCADCKPRSLDRHSAVERQKLRRDRLSNAEDPPERKTKRPPSKSHKKKAKPNELLLNGNSSTIELNAKNPHDQPPAHGHKKSKSHHRPSQSISSTTKRSPSYGNKSANPHGHPPSPATTPPDVPADLEIHNYSSGFLSLYNEDRDVQDVQTNSFASLVISNVLSLWLRDHEKLQAETGCDYNEVFQPLPSDIDAIKATPVVQHKEHSIAADVLHWQYLTTPSAIEKDTPLVELNGQIGIQKDYCEDPSNRWADLSSPLPFVFFHPMLPLYIDTRKEGSLARYVRRSCRPNATLDTYISAGSEYHFWLVSDRRIAPNEQITISWDFRLPKTDRKRILELLGLGDEETGEQPDFDATQVEIYQNIAAWLHQILSEHGGCACDLGPECAFQRFHRKYISRSHSKSGSKKKSKKPKAHAISPTSTGHATNSRAPSEGHGDEGIENDSGSSRSKPPSRDMTPAPRQGSFDMLGILTEPTDRDKRKVAMVEDSFRRMEQQQPPRKKKRTSDGTSTSGSTKSKSKPPGVQTNGVGERRYVDAGTNRSMSGSPHSVTTTNIGPFRVPRSRHGSAPYTSRHNSEGPRPEYCDAAVQTDVVVGEWFSPTPQTPKSKKRVVSLSKRLLENRHRLRADIEERRRLSTASPTSVTSAMIKMDLDSPQSPSGVLLSPASKELSISNPTSVATIVEQGADAAMTDASPVSPTEPKAISPLSVSSYGSGKHKSPELRVQLPPVPSFNSTTITASPTPTPTSGAGTLVQSPFSASSLPSPFGSAAVNGVAAHPSPVKKKLSLSDYTKSRMNKAATKPGGASLKPPAINEDAKSPTTIDIVMSDMPMAEKPTDP
ncbi:hypothetical protein BX600DRAFT_505189 [Xylariales sp. PMI_506]|nr:hypothetical protein BX600DRAFT_505189 [Xylariales sp. PMI_506]